MSQQPEPEPQDHITLYCPHCDYNLTGLPENRCPECGTPFDPAQLRPARVLTQEEVPPVTAAAAVMHLCWPFVLPPLMLVLAPLSLGPLALIAALTGSPISTLILSRRIFARRAKRAGLPFSIVRDRWPIIGVWLVLTGLQFAAAVLVLTYIAVVFRL